MKRFQNRIIANLIGLFFLAGLISGGMVMGCATPNQEIQAALFPTSISGTVVSDTGKIISEAKVVVHWTESKKNKWKGWEHEKKSKEIMSELDGSFVLEVSKKPSKIEASKPGYFSATIEPKADAILTGLKFVLESGGKIRVIIKGMEKEELGSLRVKAIAAGKEYHRSDKIYSPVMFDSIRGARLARARDGVFCEILGIPTGLAEVQASSNEEKLPSQTVQVKEGTVVNINFEYNLNKVILSGIVMQLGKPLSNWLLIFKRADGNPTPGISGIITPADGWYEIKLNPGMYEIQLSEPGVFVIDRVKVKGHELRFKKTYNITKTETLNLEVSGLKVIEPKKGEK